MHRPHTRSWSILSLNLAEAPIEGVDQPTTWVGAFVAQEHELYGRAVYPMDVYISALYWSFMTLTSIGYGDIYPHNSAERALSCVFQLISGICWAYVIGTMASIASTMDPNAIAFEATMDHLNRFMSEQHLPRPLRKTLREFFEAAKRVHRVGDDEDLLGKHAARAPSRSRSSAPCSLLPACPALSHALLSDSSDV